MIKVFISARKDFLLMSLTADGLYPLVQPDWKI